MNVLKRMKTRIIIASVVCVAVLISTLLGVQVGVSPNRSSVPTIGQQQVVITIGNPAYASGTPDYTCDGIADDVQFQGALNALIPAGGGKLVVLAGTYVFTATPTVALDNVTIEGVGMATYLTYGGGNPIFAVGGNRWVFRNFRTDAGGLGLGIHTDVIEENLLLGATYVPLTNLVGTVTLNALATPTLLAPTGRTATYTVVASNALAPVKAQADFICLPGAHDNQVQINNAITLAAGVGGIVHLSGGTFTINSSILLNQTGVVLEGEGTNTVIHVADTSNIDAINISKSRCIVKDLYIDGNSANNLVSGSGIIFTADAAVCWIEDVWSASNREYGFYIKASGGYANDSNRFISCWASVNIKDGFRFMSMGGHKIVNCMSNGNGGDGYHIESNETWISGTDADSNIGFGYLWQNGAGYGQLTNFKASANHKAGVYFYNVDHIAVSNGTVYNNALDSSGWGEIKFDTVTNNINLSNLDIHTNTAGLGGVASYGIYIDSPATGISITSSTIRNQLAGGYGVYMNGAGVVNNVIEDNTFVSIAANKGVSVAGGATLAGNMVKWNGGFVTENSGTSIGTGAEQTIAHGLGYTPTKGQIGVFSDNFTGVAGQTAIPDATNIYVTATNHSNWHWTTIGVGGNLS